jgi:hypothetical protein
MYALIKNNLVENCIVADAEFAAHIAPDWDAVVPMASVNTCGIGWTYSGGVFTAPPAPPIPPVVAATHCTKRAFQNRFPLTANGVSTKWDVMSLFLSSDSYATSIGVTGAAMHALRLLIQTGLNRMSASLYVDLTTGQEAAQFTTLLIQPGIPSEFALTAAERTKMLTDPLLDSEIYKG